MGFGDLFSLFNVYDENKAITQLQKLLSEEIKIFNEYLNLFKEKLELVRIIEGGRSLDLRELSKDEGEQRRELKHIKKIDVTAIKKIKEVLRGRTAMEGQEKNEETRLRSMLRMFIRLEEILESQDRQLRAISDATTPEARQAEEKKFAGLIRIESKILFGGKIKEQLNQLQAQAEWIATMVDRLNNKREGVIVAETKQESEIPLSSEQFQRLLEIKFNLLHTVHNVPPTEKGVIKKSIAALDKRLDGCTNYNRYLKIYARTHSMVG